MRGSGGSKTRHFNWQRFDGDTATRSPHHTQKGETAG